MGLEVLSFLIYLTTLFRLHMFMVQTVAWLWISRITNWSKVAAYFKLMWQNFSGASGGHRLSLRSNSRPPDMDLNSGPAQYKAVILTVANHGIVNRRPREANNGDATDSDSRAILNGDRKCWLKCSVSLFLPFGAEFWNRLLPLPASTLPIYQP